MRLLRKSKKMKAMKNQNNISPNLLFNPFIRVAGFKAFVIGFIIVVITSVFAYNFGTHFNGLLDIKFGSTDTNYYVFLLHGIINVSVISILLYISGRIVSKSKIRFIDVIGTQALARYPYFIAPFLNVNRISEKFGEFIMYKFLNYGEYVKIEMYEIVLAIIFILIMLLLIVWIIALMYNAYRVACNVKGTNAVISFIIAVFVAEILTLIINFAVYKTESINLNF